MNAFDRIVITGGGGMLAKALQRSLNARDLAFVAPPRADCDVASESDVSRLFREHRPTLLLNCAAYTKVDLAEKEPDKADAVNGRAVGALAAAAREYGTRIVHYSTDFVFAGSATRPYRPDDPTNPLGAYGRSKLLGEQELQRAMEGAPTPWLILRTAWLYGPGGPCFPQTILNAARAGKPLKVVDDQTGSPTFTFDLAQATLDLIDHNAPAGIWHLTNAGSVTWHGFTAAILEEFAVKADLSTTTSADWKRLRPDSATRPAYSVLDTTAFEQHVGRPMRHWRDALRDYRRIVEPRPGDPPPREPLRPA